MLKKTSGIWPINPISDIPPANWNEWPDNKKFSLVLTHDVDTQRGQNRCYKLMEIEKKLGFRSLFNFVPERYKVSSKLRKDLTQQGFEVGVHGLFHDGKLFKTRKIFRERSKKINQYLKDWNADGFRSPAMHRNLDWIHDLNIKYDLSTFDTDPFEPQSEGVGTIFPFWVKGNGFQKGYLELPYTLVQDFTLFILMKEKNPDIWKNKVDWIASKGGMALLNTHPDYMNFNKQKNGSEDYPVSYYINFLNYVKDRYEGQYWHALPREITAFFPKI
jgi:hypothetical protein